jgi:hypothetical protein
MALRHRKTLPHHSNSKDGKTKDLKRAGLEQDGKIEAQSDVSAA